MPLTTTCSVSQRQLRPHSACECRSPGPWQDSLGDPLQTSCLEQGASPRCKQARHLAQCPCTALHNSAVPKPNLRIAEMCPALTHVAVRHVHDYADD